MKRWGVLFSAILILATVGSAQASIMNGLQNASFEDGLEYWNSAATSGTAKVVSYSDYDTIWTKTPPATNLGSNFLLLTAAPSSPSFMGSASVSQTFYLQNDQSLSGWVRLETTGSPVFVYAQILEGAANGGTQVWSGTISTLTAWEAWNTSLLKGGQSYTIVFSLMDVGSSGETKMAVDMPVPIPSAVLLLASGLISLVAIRRRKAK